MELAAKAAGIEINWFKWERLTNQWNPLVDDGDALRLAASLRLTISWDLFDDCEYATATPPHTHQGYDCVMDQDPAAATRRAIVRAAAEIGKAMP
ncbi:MAG: hypothetical protein KAY21_11000 [Limnohabitans sp.]|nr:hypothetical protein [Limnohabitans sp.]